MRPALFLLPALLCALSAAAAGLAPSGERGAAGTPDVEAGVLHGRVSRVADGDSGRIELDRGPVEFRLYGIDAPEFAAPRGREAKKALERFIARREVDLLPVSRDGYDRVVAIVFAGRESVNEALLARGHAWAYRQHLGQTAGDAARYCRLEAEARAARRGLWSQPPQQWLPPWVYRLRERGVRGPVVAWRDYSRETAADCEAAAEKAHRPRQAGSR